MSHHETGEISTFPHLRPFYSKSQNEFRDEPLYCFPHAFNNNVVIDEAMKIVDILPYEEVTRNFSKYVNGVSIMSCVVVQINAFVRH